MRKPLIRMLLAFLVLAPAIAITVYFKVLRPEFMADPEAAAETWLGRTTQDLEASWNRRSNDQLPQENSIPDADQETPETSEPSAHQPTPTVELNEPLPRWHSTLFALDNGLIITAEELVKASYDQQKWTDFYSQLIDHTGSELPTPECIAYFEPWLYSSHSLTRYRAAGLLAGICAAPLEYDLEESEEVMAAQKALSSMIERHREGLQDLALNPQPEDLRRQSLEGVWGLLALGGHQAAPILESIYRQGRSEPKTKASQALMVNPAAYLRLLGTFANDDDEKLNQGTRSTYRTYLHQVNLVSANRRPAHTYEEIERATAEALPDFIDLLARSDNESRKIALTVLVVISHLVPDHLEHNLISLAESVPAPNNLLATVLLSRLGPQGRRIAAPRLLALQKTKLSASQRRTVESVLTYIENQEGH